MVRKMKERTGAKRPPLFLVAKLTQCSGCILLVLVSDVNVGHRGFDVRMAREVCDSGPIMYSASTPTGIR